MANRAVEFGILSHYGVIDYEHLLLISQPSVDSCVYIINRQWPWYAYNDSSHKSSA